MRKLFYIFISLMTFTLGTIGYYFSPKVIPVSVYDAVQNVELYKRQKIHVKGYLEVYKSKSDDLPIFASIFDYKRFCSKDCIAGADIDLNKIIENDRNLSKVVYEIAEKNEQVNRTNGSYFVEVEIIGEIEKTQGCFTSGYRIEAESINQTSPIQFMSAAELDKILGRK